MHPVGEVTVDVEGQGRVADGDVELNLKHRERNEILFLCTCQKFLNLLTDSLFVFF